MDWLRATAADLGRGIAAGRIDPVALAEAHLDAIAAHPLRDRIYARVTAGRALAEAHAARDFQVRRGDLLGIRLQHVGAPERALVQVEERMRPASPLAIPSPVVVHTMSFPSPMWSPGR